MSNSRITLPVLSIAICVVVLAALLPAAAVAAPDGGKPRQYMVALNVASGDTGRFAQPGAKVSKAGTRQRAKRADEVTARVRRELGVKPSHRFGRDRAGFAASMTAAQAAELAADPDVASIRLARIFKLAQAAEVIPPSVERVKAFDGGLGHEVDAHVAVLDTGIGFSRTDDDGVPTGEPHPTAALNTVELNIRGGVNCYDDPSTKGINEATLHPDWYADTHGHGTHVAGISGAVDNNIALVGVAPGARLGSVRVFEGSSGTEASIVCGLDWVLDRVRGGGRIDVVNMSIEGSRLDRRENCDVVRADVANGDPIQQRICDLADAGVTVVAAAGNQRMDANKSSPGGFDPVISVAAMTDTDGTGWGKGTNPWWCGYGSEQDDTFARSYSNHGREVDIVAPGTCVASLDSRDRDVAANEPTLMTGTSMAAPHVSGAVARYVDEFGSPGSTAQMRKLVRASGRMDWDARSDPVWYGVNDTDPPNRVLDVRALSGSEFVKPWIYHQKFKLGGDDRKRTTRVDIQRGGGYAGTARLSVGDLTSAVGSASFGDDTLDGIRPRDLGTNLTLTLKAKGNDGVHPLLVQANPSGVGRDPRTLTLTIDRTGPVVSSLAPKIRGGKVGVSTRGATQTYLQWQASDAMSDLDKTVLQRKIDGGAWKKAGTAGISSSRVSIKPGQSNKFRVKATDTFGNVSYSGSVWTKLTIRDSSSGQWLKPATGGWRTKPVDKAHKGSILLAKNATDSLSTTFSGKAIALMASVGPSRGKLRVRVDAGEWHTVELQAKEGGHRKVVWSRKLTKGTHTLEVQGVSGQGTLDALLILS